MRKLIISAILASTVAIAAPAAAQYYEGQRYGQGYGYGGGYGGGYQRIERQLDQLRARVQQARARGRISQREAYRLNRQVDAVDQLADRYARNGLNQWEYNDLQRRVEYLRQSFRWERRDGNDWRDGRGYDRGDGWDRDGRWDGRRRDRDDDD